MDSLHTGGGEVTPPDRDPPGEEGDELGYIRPSCLESLTRKRMDSLGKRKRGPETASLLQAEGCPREVQPEKEGAQVLTLCMRKTELPLIVIVAFVLLSCVLIGVLIGVLISVPIGYYSAPKSSPCPDDWMLVSGRCYYFSERETDWKSSEKFCTDAGGSLVMLKDNKTEEVVNRLKNKYDYWIGLKKDAQGKWKWSDGTLYTGKIAPEEDGSQLDCAYLDSRIGVLHCSSQRRWICTKDPH